MGKKLVFIYNAKGGLVHAALDTLHKVFSPSTYPCELCAITYGLTSMHAEWKEWLDQLPIPTLFLHKDELIGTDIGVNIPLPAVLLQDGGEYTTLVSAFDWTNIKDIPALIEALESKLRLIDN